MFSLLATLADMTRTRLLVALERQEFTVRELQQILQLPQSTVSRHLRLLAEEGWVTARASGASNWYRMAGRQLPENARKLWQVVRNQAAETPAARRDAERSQSVLGDRQARSRDFFASGAGQWDKLRGELFGRVAVVAPFLGLVDPEWVIADLGCGTGHLAEQLAPRVARVLAVDESAPMLAAARSRLAAYDNVELHRGGLENLPIDDGVVDVAFIPLVLHHLAEPADAIAEVGRILVPGGRLVIVDMAPHEHAEYRELMGHQWLGFDAETLEGGCRSAGLAFRTYQLVTPDPDAKGPTLFVATATKAATRS